MGGTSYIGKIAAIVTANTAGLSKNLASGAKEVTSFGLSMEGTIRRATTNAGNSFRNIFTPLQKLTQALAQAERLKFKGFEAGNAAAAIKKMEQLASAAMLVAKPLEDVQQRFQKLSLGQQAGLANELERAQGAAIALKAAIDAGLGSVDSKAATAERAIKRVTLALERAEEAGRMVAQMPTGNELAFANPGTAGRLAAAAAASRAAADAPASARMADPMIARLVGQSRTVSQNVVDAMSRVAGGGGAGAGASADLAKFEAQLDRITARLNRRLALQIDAKEAQDAVADLTKRVDAFRQKANFSLTGRAQNFDQAREEINRLLNDVKKLEAAQQGAVGNRVTRLGRLVEKEDVNDLARIQREIEKIDADIAKKLKVTLDAAEAKQQADDLIARKTKLKEDIAFSVTGNVQNFAQAKQEAGRLFAEMGKLNSAQQANVGKRLMKLDTLISSGDPAKLAQIQNLIRLINADISRKQKFNLRAEEAKKEAESLRASLRALRQDANFRITGKVQNMEQAKGEITRLIGLLTQLDAAKKKQAQTAINTAISGLMRPGADAGAVMDRLYRRLEKLGVKGVGDVGRMGMDRWTLGMNQAIFAVDDFMSATGGMEQKLRAISNNITQLGFVVGGTSGLLLGLGAVMAGQLAVGIMKWINNGRTAEDQTKALNDSLAKQISLIEELAQAFARLGDEIIGRGFSAGAKEAQKFRNEMGEIEKKQRKVREARVADLDPTVNRERAEQAKLKRERDEATDPGARVSRERQLRESERRERAAAAAAVARPAPAVGEVEAAINRARVRERNARDLTLGRILADSPPLPMPPAFNAAPGADAFALRDALQKQIDDLIAGGTGDWGGRTGGEVNQSLAELRQLIEQLENPLHAAADALENDFLRSINAISYDLENAQNQMAEAIKAGIPEAVRLQGTLDQLNNEIEAAFEEIKKAKEREDITPDEQKRIVEEQEKKVAAGRAARDAAISRAEQINYSRIVDPQKLMETRLGNARQNLSEAGLENGQLARQMRDIEARKQEIEQKSGSPEVSKEERAELEKQLAAVGKEVAAIDAATTAVREFTKAIGDAGNRALQDAKSRRDAAVAADIARSTPQTVAARKRAEDDVTAIEKSMESRASALKSFIEGNQQNPDVQRLSEIDSRLARGRWTTAEQDAEMRAGEEEIRRRRADPRLGAFREARERSDEFARVFATTGAAATDTFEGDIDAARAVPGMGAATDDLERILAEFGDAAKRSGLGLGGRFWEQGRELEVKAREDEEKLKQLEADTARGNLTSEQRQALQDERRAVIDRLGANNAELQKAMEQPVGLSEQQKSLERGLELAKTPEQRAREETAQKIADLKTANAPQAAINRTMKEMAQSVAPMIMGFREERANAILQGPSRAALNVSDVNTTEGSRELNRLLRGDDPAKDVNLVELKKQSDLLEAILKQARDQGAVVDMR